MARDPGTVVGTMVAAMPLAERALGRGQHEAEWAPSCVHSTQSCSFPGLRARARRYVRPVRAHPNAERALSGRVIPVPWSGQWLLRRERPAVTATPPDRPPRTPA